MLERDFVVFCKNILILSYLHSVLEIYMSNSRTKYGPTVNLITHMMAN